MRKIFGTDGVRGVANTEPMTVDTALRLGQAAAHLFSHKTRHGRFLIGKDTRLSCYMFENAIAAGIMSMGADVFFVGPLPTPAIAYLTCSMRADAGIVISASHNPFEHNGIKFFSSAGHKLADEVEARMEQLMGSDELRGSLVRGENIGRSRRIDDAAGRYITFCKNSFPGDLTLDDLRIVVDCANGAAYKVAPLIFGELGAEVIPLGVSPNGVNINGRVGALYPESVAEAVHTYRADLGIALDGDADRLIILDEKGQVVDGDAILALIARELLQEGRLANRTLVTTVMSNLGLDRALRDLGGSVVRTQVGDRYVFQAMLEGGHNLGGEQSGHIILRDFTTTGDGIIAALQVLAILRRRNRPMSELARLFDPFPQVLINVDVERKPPLEGLARLQAEIGRVEAELGATGRVLVRYSGTENKVRILVECESDGAAQRHAQDLATVCQAECR